MWDDKPFRKRSDIQHHKPLSEHTHIMDYKYLCTWWFVQHLVQQLHWWYELLGTELALWREFEDQFHLEEKHIEQFTLVQKEKNRIEWNRIEKKIIISSSLLSLGKSSINKEEYSAVALTQCLWWRTARLKMCFEEGYDCHSFIHIVVAVVQ